MFNRVTAARSNTTGRNNIRPKRNEASQRRARIRKLDKALQAVSVTVQVTRPALAVAAGAAC